MNEWRKILPPGIPEDRFEAGLRAYRKGAYFEAHELWEEIFHLYPRGDPRRLFIQALIQIAVAALKAETRNRRGMEYLCRQAKRNLEKVIVVPEFKSWAFLLPRLEELEKEEEILARIALFARIFSREGFPREEG